MALCKSYVTFLLVSQHHSSFLQLERQVLILLIKYTDRYYLKMDIYSNTIDYEDTSLRKYPYNKYIDAEELASLTHNIFDLKARSRTIDVCSKKIKPSNLKKLTKKNAKKSLTTTIKTASSSRANVSAGQKKNRNSIQLDDWKDYTKQEIAEELKHYQVLSLQLRKQNYTLKQKIREQASRNKDAIIELQEKVNKLAHDQLKKREENLAAKEQIINKKQKKKNESSKQKFQENGQRNERKSEFKRFFLHFMDRMGRLDQKMQRKILKQKTLESKLLHGQNILVQISDFLHEKKYKFKSIYQ